MKNKVLSFLLSMAMVLALLLTGTVVMAADTVSADGAEGGYGIIVGGVEITSENLTVDSSSASDVITSGSAVYDPDTETLTLKGLTVNMTNGTSGGAAIRVCAGTHITIILEDTNTLTASAGYAGIAVEAGWDDAGDFSPEKSAQIEIDGDGSLEVWGGDTDDNPSARMAAGAGIGGDGVNLKNSDSLNGGDFGCITISGGTITAYGGACADTHPNASTTDKVADNYFGGGAGIGGGGIGDDNSDNWWTYAGSITITGGTVTANGGITANTTYNKTSGGAGIGTGSTGSNFSGDSEVTVTISGGTVTAIGGSDGAGIGGGSNVSNSSIVITGDAEVLNGSIVITGDADVTATGGDHEDDTAYGGAGIGGGDNGFSGLIEISGKAQVNATGGGAAAGIGGGYTGIADNITITGEASVEAYGGSNTDNTRGGAGIGSGGQSYAYGDVIEGTITLNSSGRIQAVAGYGAQAVGIGTIRDENVHSYTLTIGTETNELWMINRDTAQSAFWGQNDAGTEATDDLSITDCTVVWYTGSEPAESGTAYAYDGETVEQYGWTFAEKTLTLTKDGTDVKSIETEQDTLSGNWAVVVDSLPVPLTDIVWVGGQGMTASEDGTVVSYYTNGADGAAGTVSQTQPAEYHAKLYYDTAAEAYTLELNGLDAAGIANDADSCGAGIYSTVPLTINIAGDNTVVGSTINKNSYGIRAPGLVINGDEEATLNVGSTDVSGYQDDYSCGIYSEGNVVINTSNIKATGGDAADSKKPGWGVGIYVVGKLIINNSDIEAVGTDSGFQSAGIYVVTPANTAVDLYYIGGGESSGGGGSTVDPGGEGGTTTAEGGLTINGGKVIAAGGRGFYSGLTTAYSNGIFTYGAITIKDADLTATSDFGVEYTSAIQSYMSDITISDSEVTATSGDIIDGGSWTCRSVGLEAANNFTSTNSTVVVNSGETKLNTNAAVYVEKDIIISGGSLTANGAPAGVYSYGILLDHYGSHNDCSNSHNLTIKDGAQVTAASDTAGYLSYGTFVYGNFHMSDNNSALTTSSGVVESNTSSYVNRSAGLYLGDDRYEDGFNIDDTFTITGGTLKAWCDTSDSQNAKEAVAVGLLDVVDDKFVFSDGNQPNDKWYEWTLQSDENGDPVNKIMSTDKAYVHNDADENWKSSYLYIAPIIIKHTVTYELDGGTGADGVDYSPQTVTDGTEITVKEAPTKSGYTFKGYSDGTSTYNPGDKIIVNADITLTAQWRKNSQPGGGSTPRGHVVLTKVDANDSSTLISNVEFKLYKSNGSLVGTYTTDKNGKITVNRLQTGKYYWLETRPAEGYMLDDTKHEFEIVRNKTTEITVTNSRSSVPGVFRDEHYAYVVGYPDGFVRPEANITRAEVATIFFRLLNDETRTQYMTKDNSFSDVNADAWYNTAVSTMAKMGIVKGYPDGEFKPDENITRAEFAAIAARFDEKSAGTDNASFSDIVNHWAENEINKAVSNGWVLGYEDGTFCPEKSITRAETMTLVNRVLQRIPEGKEDLLADMIEWPDNANEDAWYYLAVQEATNSHECSRKVNGYEKWTELTETFDWAELEK